MLARTLSLLTILTTVVGCGGNPVGTASSIGLDEGRVQFSSPTNFNGERSEVTFRSVLSDLASIPATIRAGGTDTSGSPDRLVEIDIDSIDLTSGANMPIDGTQTILRYRQGGFDFRDWHSMSGNLHVLRADETHVVIQLQNVRVEAADGTAQGAVTLNGTFDLERLQ